MIGATFWLAYDLFKAPPNLALQIIPGQTMDLGKTAGSLLQIFVKMLALVLMMVFGSSFANRGIKLYEAGRPRGAMKPKRAPKEVEVDRDK